MRNALIISGLMLFVLGYGVHWSEARPGKRYDERARMCRTINDGSLDWDSEAWGAGGIKFREVCKSCHTRNNDKGAPFLYMESYGSEGWNSVFAKRRKKCARDGSWDVLTEEELQLVNDYLYRNANDTYDPNDADSCG
ncbi:MAG: hypothetical protein L3J49_04130 [Desulfobulbaceae bacterium]|nr:hypothetical protein [Desulfobulbaceae bacterium]